MTNITELALAIDAIAANFNEDPFELFRAALNDDFSSIDDDAIEGVAQVKTLINGLNPFEIARIDRIVFNNATGQADQSDHDDEISNLR
jgi:hypothetical protein